MRDRPLLRLVMGPTASGKERLAVACAERLGAEILSVDSMKIYRGLDIGTAKADAALRARVPHHGLDLADPTETFSVAQYVDAAEAAIAEVTARGKPIILSGGTALYLKGLLEGLFDGPAADPDLRERLRARAEAEGPAALYAELQARDPVAAAKLHPNDVRRVVRALEVIETTGTPISQQQQQWEGFHAEAGVEGAPAYRYPCAMVALHWPREQLHQRIALRVERMLEAGLLEEARTVHDNRDRYSHTPLQAVGYKELFPYFDGSAPLAACVERLKINTRQLAKSQMTWLRKFPCSWIDADAYDTPDGLAAATVELWSRGAS